MLLHVNIFNTSNKLPLLAAIANGCFAERGLVIEVQDTPNSNEQRAELAQGRFDIERAAMAGLWGGTPPAAGKYTDLSFYSRTIQSASTADTNRVVASAATQEARF